MPEKSSLRHFISVTRSLVQYITYTTTKVICNVVVAPGICCKVPHHALLSFVKQRNMDFIPHHLHLFG